MKKELEYKEMAIRAKQIAERLKPEYTFIIFGEDSSDIFSLVNGDKRRIVDLLQFVYDRDSDFKYIIDSIKAQDL